MAASPQINIVAEPVFRLGQLSINNSMLLGLIGTIAVLSLLFYTRHRIQHGRRTLLAMAVLWLFEWLLDTAEEVLGSRRAARQAAPLAITMFFLVMINNWLGILPIVGPLTWHGLPLLRGLSADLNFTFALALISFLAAQLWAIRQRGFFGNLRRYLANPLTKPLEAYQGLLEVIAEFARTTALSLRLFGNVFGGEVLLMVITFLTRWAVPVTLPLFMFLELFVGAVQAYIFFMLTITFISLGSRDSQARQPVAAALPAN